MNSRYSYGGDEHIFVECDEEMSLEAFFKSLSVTKAVRTADIKGVTEICPANASSRSSSIPTRSGRTISWREIKNDRGRGREATTPSSRRASSRSPCSTTIPGRARP